jgi:cytoskeletal protein CcmA (bactofilin family)
MAMLKREEGAGPALVGSDLNALLGRGSEFEGKLTFEGTVRIDGKFNGTIASGDTLVVGEGAQVTAEVTCGTLVVHGEVTGNVHARVGVELHPPARVRGTLETPSLMIAKGVVFEGQCKMDEASGARAGKTPLPGPVAVK